MIVAVETNVDEVRRNLELKARKLSKVAQDTAKELGTLIVADYRLTVATWQEKPEFTNVVEVSGNTVSAFVGTDSLPYLFLDKGTKVRYATMSPDFVAKTQPGVLGSRAGRGHMVFVDTSRPRPGIEARGFTEIIQKKYDELAGVIAAKHVMQWQAQR